MPAAQSHQQLLILPENKLAWAALENFTQPINNKGFKSIFMYGATGSGKSALIRQFWRMVRESRSVKKLEVITSQEFASKLADASDAGTIIDFQSEFQGLELLVLEDLQLLRNRRETQKQLVRVIDEILERGGRVVLTANSLPGHWKGFQPRLIDRCHGALSVSLDLPSLASRKKLITHFFHRDHIPVPARVVELIAQREDFSPRDIESFVKRMVDRVMRSKETVTEQLVINSLEREIRAEPVSLKQIVRSTARHFGIKLGELKSESRRSDIVFARQCAMYLAREMTDETQVAIAKSLGMADHTSVIRGVKRIQGSLDDDSETRRELSELRDQLRGN